jgi:hypothetical protein
MAPGLTLHCGEASGNGDDEDSSASGVVVPVESLEPRASQASDGTTVAEPGGTVRMPLREGDPKEFEFRPTRRLAHLAELALEHLPAHASEVLGVESGP